MLRSKEATAKKVKQQLAEQPEERENGGEEKISGIPRESFIDYSPTSTCRCVTAFHLTFAII